MSTSSYTKHIVREWYVGTDTAKLSMYACIAGCISGFFVGKWNWAKKLDYDVADTLEITSYKLPYNETLGEPIKIKEFENAWNNCARFAQKMPGYQWTKLYKSRDWTAPVDYIQMRLWKDCDAYEAYRANEKGYEFMKKELLEENGATATAHTYMCIVDDTVRRVLDVK